MKWRTSICIPLLIIMTLSACSREETINFTEEDAVNMVKKYYGDNKDIFFVCVDSKESIEGKKVYQVCVKSENQMIEGGSGTISVVRIDEDGNVLN
ncbi:MAG: hypothetical protein ACRDA3_00300 [Peptostreptococcaceae bacterium]